MPAGDIFGPTRKELVPSLFAGGPLLLPLAIQQLFRKKTVGEELVPYFRRAELTGREVRLPPELAAKFGQETILPRRTQDLITEESFGKPSFEQQLFQLLSPEQQGQAARKKFIPPTKLEQILGAIQQFNARRAGGDQGQGAGAGIIGGAAFAKQLGIDPRLLFNPEQRKTFTERTAAPPTFTEKRTLELDDILTKQVGGETLTLPDTARLIGAGKIQSLPQRIEQSRKRTLEQQQAERDTERLRIAQAEERRRSIVFPAKELAALDKQRKAAFDLKRAEAVFLEQGFVKDSQFVQVARDMVNNIAQSHGARMAASVAGGILIIPVPAGKKAAALADYREKRDEILAVVSPVLRDRFALLVDAYAASIFGSDLPAAPAARKPAPASVIKNVIERYRERLKGRRTQ